MKKLFKITVLVFVVICAALFFACDNGGNTDGKTGLLYKMYDGDDFYTVYGYVKEEGETELDIGAFNKDGVVIKRIKTGAFKDNDSLKKITVPDTVEIIDGGAFAKMKALEELNLPFIGKTAVADVYINSTPDEKATEKSVEKERNFGYIFGTEEYDGGVGCTQNYDASNTETYYLPETLRKISVNPKADGYGIPMYAFSGNAWINEIVLSENVKVIGESAFKDNVYLKTVNLENIEKIYDNAFNGAQNFEKADLKALTFMGNTCFQNCAALNSVSINTDIKADTFNGCKNLTALTVGENVNNIGARAFNGCKNITTVEVPGDVDNNSWTVGNLTQELNAENIKDETYSILAWERVD